MVEWPLNIEVSCEYATYATLDENRQWPLKGGELVVGPATSIKYHKSHVIRGAIHTPSPFVASHG